MKKDHALNLFFNQPKKSPWEFLYPVKKWSPKNSFSKRKNLRESIESNFYKLVNLIAKDLPVCTIFLQNTACKKVAFNALSGFFASKMSFWRSFFKWIEKFSWTFFLALKNELSAWSSSILAIGFFELSLRSL